MHREKAKEACDVHAKAQAICGRSLARLALTEGEIKSIRVPIAVAAVDGLTAGRAVGVEREAVGGLALRNFTKCTR